MIHLFCLGIRMLCFYFFNLALEVLSYFVLTSNIKSAENRSSRKYHDQIYSSIFRSEEFYYQDKY